MTRLTVLLLLLISLTGCVPGENPRNNLVMPLLLSSKGNAAPGPDVIPYAVIDTVFPTSGPYKLQVTEKTAYVQMMNERYNDGFYDPDVQIEYSKDFTATVKFALDTDGVQYTDLLGQFEKDVQTNLADWDPWELESFQFTAGNSMVMSTEMLHDPIFSSNGVTKEQMSLTIESMQRIRTMAIDELRHRGEVVE